MIYTDIRYTFPLQNMILHSPSKRQDPQRAGIGIVKIGIINGCLHVYKLTSWYDISSIYMVLPLDRTASTTSRYGYTRHYDNRYVYRLTIFVWYALMSGRLYLILPLEKNDATMKSALISGRLHMSLPLEGTSSTASRYWDISKDAYKCTY